MSSWAHIESSRCWVELD